MSFGQLIPQNFEDFFIQPKQFQNSYKTLETLLFFKETQFQKEISKNPKFKI